MIVNSIKKQQLLAQHNQTRRQNHYTIPENIINKISQEFEQHLIKEEEDKLSKKSPNHEICRVHPAELPISIIIDKEDKDINNNKQASSEISDPRRHEMTQDINFQTIGTELTPKQLEVLRKSINFAVRSGKLLVDEAEVLEEMRFSILHPSQRHGIATYMHALNRCIKLLKNRDWKTPFGFGKYSTYGVELKQARESALNEHIERKQMECSSSKQVLENLNRKEAEVFNLGSCISNLANKFNINKK